MGPGRSIAYQVSRRRAQQRSSLTLECCPSCSGVGNALNTGRQGSSRETTTTNTVQNVSPLFFPGSFSRFVSFKIPNPLVLKRFPLPVLPFYMMQLSVPEVKQLGLHWLLWWFGTASANLNYTAWHSGVYNGSAQLGMETLYDEETWQDLQNPVDSQALNELTAGRSFGKICEPGNFMAVLVPPSQLHSTQYNSWSYFTVDITLACHYIKEKLGSLKSYVWQVVFRLVAF